MREGAHAGGEDLHNLEHLLGPEVVTLDVGVDRADRCVRAEDAVRVGVELVVDVRQHAVGRLVLGRRAELL